MSVAIEEKLHSLHITDATGDTRIMWDPRSTDDVKIAKKAFNTAKGKGMLAYSVGTDGESTGEVIREFDPKYGKIIMTGQLVGG